MTDLLFFPAQPDLMKLTHSYVELNARGNSEIGDIALYYQFEIRNQKNFISLVPDGCFDLLFHLDENNPQVYLWTTPYEKKEQKFLHVNGRYFGIRFWPEQTSIIFKESMHDLIERVIPLKYLLDLDERIYDRLLAAPDFMSRVRIFDSFLSSLKCEPPQELTIVKYVSTNLYKGQSSLKSIAQSAGYSEQYIRRIFDRFIGMSPKRFAQIVQLQKILSRIDLQYEVDIKNLLIETDYYDQAHFIKCFKKFMHTTPKKYIELNNQLGWGRDC